MRQTTRQEEAFAGLAQACSDCVDAGMDPFEFLDPLASERNWTGKKTAWPEERLDEAARLLLGWLEGRKAGNTDKPGELFKSDNGKSPEYSDSIRKSLAKPTTPRARYPYLKNIESHFHVSILAELDDEHVRRGLPTRAEDWGEDQWAEAALRAADAAQAAPGYADELGPRPVALKVAGDYIWACRKIAESRTGEECPTTQQVGQTIGDVWREANGVALADHFHKVVLAMREPPARMFALRRALLYAERELKSIEALCAEPAECLKS